MQHLLVNAQTEQLFGYPRAELLDSSSRSSCRQRFESTSQTSAEFFATPKSARWAPASSFTGCAKTAASFRSNQPEPLETEEGTLVSSASRDITERKKAEEKFRRLSSRRPIHGDREQRRADPADHAQTEKVFGYGRRSWSAMGGDADPERFRKSTGHRTSFFATRESARWARARALRYAKTVASSRSNQPDPLETEDGTLVSSAIETSRAQESEKNSEPLESAPDAGVIVDTTGASRSSIPRPKNSSVTDASNWSGSLSKY